MKAEEQVAQQAAEQPQEAQVEKPAEEAASPADLLARLNFAQVERRGESR